MLLTRPNYYDSDYAEFLQAPSLRTVADSVCHARLPPIERVSRAVEKSAVEQIAAAIMEHREKQSGKPDLEHGLFELESLPDEGAHCFMAEETRSTNAGKRHE